MIKNLRQNVVKKTFTAVYFDKGNPQAATRTVPIEAESITAAFLIANQDVRSDELEVRVYDDSMPIPGKPEN